MAEAVLDASAVLAWLQHERGREIVGAVLKGARICSINYAEVASKLSSDGKPSHLIEEALAELPLLVVAADSALALEAGLMRAATRHLGLSLGDRFCIALGLRRNLPVYTADRRWAELGPPSQIRLIR